MPKTPSWLPTKVPAIGSVKCVIPIVELDKTGTQVRTALDEATVAKYAEIIKSEGHDALPAVLVYWDGEFGILADGFHRTEATLRAGGDQITCEVEHGTRRDAILAALQCNKGHGLPLSNTDKRKAVGMMLEDSEWSGWADSVIAKKIGCGHSLVGKIRDERRKSLSTVESDKPRTYTTKQGKTAVMKTGNIGKKAEPAVETQESKSEEEELSPVDQALANGAQWDKAKRHLETEVFGMFKALSELPGGAFLDANKLQEVKGKLANVVEILRDTKPYAECPYCKKGCKACRNSGYVPAHIHRNAPKKGEAK